MDLGGHGEFGGRAGNHPATGDGDQRIAPSMGVRPTMPQTTNDNPVIDLGVLSAEPAEEYHAKAGEYLSSHHLLDFMACPWLYRKKQLGLVRDEDAPALLLGRATHVRILE